jgi:hypothetical protein
MLDDKVSILEDRFCELPTRNKSQRWESIEKLDQASSFNI